MEEPTFVCYFCKKIYHIERVADTDSKGNLYCDLCIDDEGDICEDDPYAWIDLTGNY